MALTINSIYQQYQQSRDLVPDEVLHALFQTDTDNLTTMDSAKESRINDIVTYAQTQNQLGQMNVLRFKSLVDPF